MSHCSFGVIRGRADLHACAQVICKWNVPVNTPLYSLCKDATDQFCYSHNAAISLGRSAPNRPNRWLLASRSKGEWLRMELKVNGYIARGKPVMCRTWCSLLVAIMKSALLAWVSFFSDFLAFLFSSFFFFFVTGLGWVWNGLVPFSPSRLLASLPSGRREVRGTLMGVEDLERDQIPCGQDLVQTLWRQKDMKEGLATGWNQALIIMRGRHNSSSEISDKKKSATSSN